MSHNRTVDLRGDGVHEDEAGDLETDALFYCESCGRFFENDPALRTEYSGSSVTCLHCFFNGHHGDLYDEFRDEVEGQADMAGQPIGGVEGYRARLMATHDTEACPWLEMAGGCHLCDRASTL